MTPVGPVSAALSAGTGASAATALTQAGQGFSKVMGSALGSLGSSESQAATLSLEMATGQNVPLGTALVAASQASLASEAAVTVMSKALQAYQSIMSMQV